MAGKTISIPIEFGGLDNVGVAGSLGDKAGTAQDVQMGLHGEIKVPYGCADYTPYLSATVYGIFGYMTPNVGVPQIVWWGNDAANKVIIKHCTITDTTNQNAIRSGGADDDIFHNPSFKVLSNKLFIADCWNKIISWDGSLSGSVSLSASCLERHQDRLFATGVDLTGLYTNRNTLYWSSIADGTAFPAANYEIIGSSDGDYIQAIRSYQDSLFAFKNQISYKISGSDFDPTSGNYTMEGLEHVAPGPLNNLSVCNANNKLYWISKQGLIEFNGATVKNVSMGRLAFNLGSDTARIINFQEDGEIWFASDGWDSKIYVYNYYIDKFYKIDQTYISAMHKAVIGTYNIYFTAHYTGNKRIVKQRESTTYNYSNNAVSSSYKTDFLTPSPTRWQPRKLHLILKNQTDLNLVVTVYADYNTTDVLYTRTITQADLTGAKSNHLAIELPSKYIDSIQFVFSNAVKSYGFTIVKAWYEAIVEDVGDRYSGNRRIE